MVFLLLVLYLALVLPPCSRWPEGGKGTPGYIPKRICLLFMFIHIMTPFGWRHVYVALLVHAIG